MKEIFFLIRDIHFGGGGERVAINLANYFVDHQYDVTIVTIAVPEKENIFIPDPRIKIHYLNVDFRKGFKVIQKIRSIRKVRHYFFNSNIHGVILGIGTYPNLALSFVSRKLDFKKVGCQHCSYNSLNVKWKWLGKTFFPNLDALVSLTEKDVPGWRKMNPNVYVIPNAFTFYPAEPALLDKKVLLSVGRIDFSKGFDLLLDVFERFSEKCKDWKLRIIGDGPMKTQIIGRIHKCGLGNRIEIHPPTPNIMEEYRKASVFVMTSRSEGLPMVLLEAKACGLPLISFDVNTGPSEIIRDKIDGFLIKRFEVEKMADKLLEFCNDHSKRKLFGTEARKDVKRFSPELIGKKWKALFSEISPEIN